MRCAAAVALGVVASVAGAPIACDGLPPRGDTGPAVARLAERLGEQAALLAEWLGPAAEADPGPRLPLAGSDAVVVPFRTRAEDVFAAYKLAGEETVQMRLNVREARLFRRGQTPRTLRGEGGVFLVPLTTVPTYLVVRRADRPNAAAP
ncbi:MAG: hypothetical protein FJ290_25920 [Planctomycetes bacterium]|nr:hypothetical protein [Planctomycetota bacterium]